VEYFPNGKPRMSSVYKDDVLNGDVRTYSEDGKLKQVVQYQNGKPAAAPSTTTKPAPKKN
jgi:antitoxin component YwqK of YwqJK toxin-antitoxin module